MKRVWVAGWAWLFLLSAVVAGCGGGSGAGGAGSSGEEQVLKLNLPSGEPTSLDPAQAFDQDSMEVVHNLFEGLMRLDKNGKPQPAVAEHVEQSEDGLTYTFHLREDAKWSNGEPLTAHDFEYAWKRVLDPDTAASPAFLLFFIKNAEKYNAGKAEADEVGVKARDERTLEVKLEQPTPFFEELTAYTPFVPVYKKGLEENPKMFADGKSFVSNGPFKMKGWKHDDKITAVKNEHYRDAKSVKLDGIEWAMYKDDTTAYQMYKTGKLHVNNKPPEDLQGALIKKGEAKVMEDSGLEFYRFNVKKKPFTNPKIRQAFALAVDRKAIVDQVVQGGQTPALAFVAPGTTTESGDFRADGAQYLEDAQFEKAKELLKEGMKEEGWDELPTVELLFSEDEKNKKVAEAIQEMYRKHLGVNIKLRAKEIKVFFDDQKSGNYTLSRSSFLPDYNDPYNYLESFQTGHPMNRTGWSNKQYDQLLKKARMATAEQERMEALHEAEKLLFEEMPIFPIYYYNDVFQQQPEVKNVIRHAVGPNDYKYVEIKE